MYPELFVLLNSDGKGVIYNNKNNSVIKTFTISTIGKTITHLGLLENNNLLIEFFTIVSYF